MKKKSKDRQTNEKTSDIDGLDLSDEKVKTAIDMAAKKMTEFLDNNPELCRDLIVERMANTELAIRPEDWTATHPFLVKCGSDDFYSRLATRLYYRFSLVNIEKGMPEGTLYVAARSIAAYLEDVVSETGVWQAIRNIYQRRYGKTLPFYDVDREDYFEDDINIDDLRLLVWQAFSRCGDLVGKTYSPISQAVFELADIAFEMLVDVFEMARVSSRSRDTLLSVFRSGDYYKIRELGYWLNAQCPLTAAPFSEEEMKENVADGMESVQSLFADEPFGLKELVYLEKVSHSWESYMSLLGCPTSELLSELASIHKFPNVAKNLRDFKVIPMSDYVVEDAKGKYVTLRDVTGKEIKVLRNSFGKNVDWDRYGSGVFGLARYGGDYYQNGIATFSEELPKRQDKLVLTEITDKMRSKLNEIIERHGGRLVYYCKTPKEISKLLDTPNLSKEDLKKIGRHDNYLVTLSRLHNADGASNIVVQPDWCEVFEDKDNPFRNSLTEDELERLQFGFICEIVLPDDVIDYIVEHKFLSHACLNASQGKEIGREILQDNMGFFFRFFRVDTYPVPKDLPLPPDFATL